jgi:hypothetical protein
MASVGALVVAGDVDDVCFIDCLKAKYNKKLEARLADTYDKEMKRQKQFEARCDVLRKDALKILKKRRAIVSNETQLKEYEELKAEIDKDIAEAETLLNYRFKIVTKNMQEVCENEQLRFQRDILLYFKNSRNRPQRNCSTISSTI